MTPERSSPRNAGWRARDVARASAVALFIYGAARLLMVAHALVFVAFLGVLLGLAVSSGAERLQRLGIRRGAGAGIIVVGALALLIAFGALSGPTIRRQYRELRERLPIAFAKLDRWIAQRQGGLIGTLIVPDTTKPNAGDSAPQRRLDSAITAQVRPPDTLVVRGAPIDSLAHLKAIKERLLDEASGARGYLFPVIHSTVAAATGVVLVIFLAIYVGADADSYRRGILALVPHRRRQRWEQVLDACANGLRRWLTTQLIAMLTIGVVSTATLLALGVRSALPLGILAGLLEFVPTIGPLLSAIPAVAMAFVDSPEKAAAVAIAYWGIQFMENHLLIPLLMKEGVDLPPVLTILTQATMAVVFGVVGLFVAVPLLVLATILVKMLYIEDVIGDSTPLPYTDQPPPAPPVTPEPAR